MSAVTRFLINCALLFVTWLRSVALGLVPKRYRAKSIAGQAALVTGGGSGIGRLLCLRFAAKGARVVVWDLNLKAAEETAQLVREADPSAEAWAFACDVSRREEVYAAAERVKQEVGKVDILVNNAGIVTGKRFLDCPDNMIQKTFEVNAMSHFWTCKAFLPDMQAENKGHVVCIASMAGLAGTIRLTDYCASKFAAVGFEESLRMELYNEGYTGIHSTVVCPYYTNTGMFAGAKPGLIPMLTPEYVADQIIDAVLVNQEVLLLPKWFNIFILMKWVFPAACVLEAMAKMDLSTSMHGFKGTLLPQPRKKIDAINNNVKAKGL